MAIKFSINDPVNRLRLVSPEIELILKHLGITTLENLLFYFPRDWQDLSQIQTISQIRPEEKVTIKATLKSLGIRRSPRRRMSLTEALLEDETGSIQAVWFNQPFLRNTLQMGKQYYFSGKAQIYSDKNHKNRLQLAHPTFEAAKADTIHTAGIIPVYQLTEGITEKQIRYWIKQGLQALTDIADFLPQTIQTKLNLLGLQEAVKNIHFPDTKENLEAARKRLAFDELFLFQLAFLSYKKKLKALPAPQIEFRTEIVKKIVESLPFSLTASQRLAAWEILKDLSEPHPMNRLLEGEVGSGKTVVAGIAMYETAHAGYQSVLLAPTEILAMQHYQTLNSIFRDVDISISLWTRSHKIGELQNSIVIGTHALLQEHIKFEKIGLVIVDEQHRFGVKQRAQLARGQTLTDTQTNADEKNHEFLYGELTYAIRKCVFDVRKKLGLGHKELIYQKALAEELKSAGIAFEREKIINIIYNGKKIGIYQPDFLVENKVILELKALPFVGGVEKKQIWTYLKGSPYRLALLINFAPSDVEISRIVYDTAREDQRESASSPRKSAEVVPHLLSMSATPIPRTLALAFYGDLDISQLKELPRGRKKIITKLVAPEHREAAYEVVRKELARGRQAYVVTALIDESDNLFTKAATKEIKNLKTIFPEFKIDLLHGRMNGDEKKAVMEDYKTGRTQILVSTTVIEVGVDVPNATIMVIENAERFGLATLHQLRGRVGRSSLQSLCLLFAENLNDYTKARLEAVVNSNDGFELAEIDLELRGPGEILGDRQSGYIPFKIAKISDRQLIKLARQTAEKLLKDDPNLDHSPLLKTKVQELASNAHLE